MNKKNEHYRKTVDATPVGGVSYDPECVCNNYAKTGKCNWAHWSDMVEQCGVPAPPPPDAGFEYVYFVKRGDCSWACGGVDPHCYKWPHTAEGQWWMPTLCDRHHKISTPGAEGGCPSPLASSPCGAGLHPANIDDSSTRAALCTPCWNPPDGGAVGILDQKLLDDYYVHYLD